IPAAPTTRTRCRRSIARPFRWAARARTCWSGAAAARVRAGPGWHRSRRSRPADVTRDAARPTANHAPSGQALPSFGVVIPAYQEADGVGACVRAVDAVLRELPNDARLIVVDDGSTDGTGEVLAKAAVDAPTLVLAAHASNRGYGAALQTGVAQAA